MNNKVKFWMNLINSILTIALVVLNTLILIEKGPNTPRILVVIIWSILSIIYTSRTINAFDAWRKENENDSD